MNAFLEEYDTVIDPGLQLMIADLLSNPPTADSNMADAFYIKCKDDVYRMMDLLDRHRGSPEMKKNRRDVLQAAYERMVI